MSTLSIFVIRVTHIYDHYKSHAKWLEQRQRIVSINNYTPSTTHILCEKPKQGYKIIIKRKRYISS